MIIILEIKQERTNLGTKQPTIGRIRIASPSFSGWWFQIFFIFTPNLGVNDPILTIYIIIICFKGVGSTTNPVCFCVVHPGTELRFQSCVDVVNGHPIDGLFCCRLGLQEANWRFGVSMGWCCQVRRYGCWTKKIGGKTKPPKWMVYNYNGKPYIKIGWFGGENPLFSGNIHMGNILLLMVQKSGKLTSWGKGSWNPIIYKVFVHARWLFGISDPSTELGRKLRWFSWWSTFIDGF